MLKRTVMSYYYDDDDVNFTRKMCVSIVCWLFDGVSRSLLYDRAVSVIQCIESYYTHEIVCFLHVNVSWSIRT